MLSIRLVSSLSGMVTGRASVLAGLAVGATLALSGSSHAAITVYNSLAAFNAAVVAPGTDTFTGFSITGTTPSPINRSAGPYGYTAATSASTFFGAGTTGNPWLSTNQAGAIITFNNFTGGVSAAGGNFFTSNAAGAFAAGDVTLTATDGSGTITQTILGSTTSSFLGFVSDGPLASVTLASIQPTSGSAVWPTADNFVLARVPEPATLSTLAAGAMFLRRRR